MLQAGRDLDALLAREVMGLDPVRASPDDMIFTGDREWVLPGDYWYHDETRGTEQIVPAYSTDISAAWLVVEKMMKTDDEIFGRWMRTRELYEGGEVPGVCMLLELAAAEAAHAICLAALKVMEESPR